MNDQTMIVLGIDVGLFAIKLVLRDREKIHSQVYIPCGKDPSRIGIERGLALVLQDTGLMQTDLRRIVITGIKKTDIGVATKEVPQSLCLARGINLVFPSVRTMLDMGARRTVAYKFENGLPIKSVENNKCAAGSGLYLNMVAKILGMSVEEIGGFSLRSREPVEVLSTCAVFAESEIISLIHMNKHPEDILKGVFKALASRTYPLLAYLSFQKDVAMVGGVARNIGMVRALEEQLGLKILVPPDPEMIGAMGAAIIAMDDLDA